jgi:hypothetical protein
MKTYEADFAKELGNLAQCDYCKLVIDWDDVPVVNDNPWCSDGTVTCCPECNQGESFSNYIKGK